MVVVAVVVVVVAVADVVVVVAVVVAVVVGGAGGMAMISLLFLPFPSSLGEGGREGVEGVCRGHGSRSRTSIAVVSNLSRKRCVRKCTRECVERGV